MATEATETQDVSVGQEVPSTGRGGFSLLLVVVAVFPIALGIGFTLQAVSPPPAQLAAAEQPEPAVPNQIQPRPLAPGPDRAKGDELLREGRYEAALHLYQSLGSTDSLRVAPELSLRFAFCQEGLGRWDEALATYRQVADSNQPILAISATLGQARVWMRLNDFANAEPLLRSLLLQSDRLPPNMKQEVALLYAISAAEQILPPAVPMTAGLVPVGNQLEWSQPDILQWGDAKSEATTASEDESLKVVWPPRPATDGDADVLANPVIGPELLSTVVGVRSRQQSVAATLTQLLDKSGLRLDWPADLQRQAGDRNLSVSVRDLPFSLMLTALCHELRATWSFRPQTQTLVIQRIDTEADTLQRHASASAMLAAVIESSSNHRLVPSAKFARAQIAAADNRLNDAAEAYSELIGRSITPLSIRAAFNAALAYHRDGNLVGTCKVLEVVVHGAPSSDLHTRSMVLYGRTLMDLGDFHEAAFQLKRAAGSRQTPDDQAHATVFLAMAQLLDGKPFEAGESLFQHRLQFQDRSVRNAASLMTSLARWRTANAVGKTREAAFLYRAIVAVDEDSEWLGPTGQLLLGQAMLEADLNDRMAQLFTRALEKGVCEMVETQMKLALADYWFVRGRKEDARVVWLAVYAMDRRESISAGMHLAELALEEQDLALCMEICRSLQNRDGVSKSELLKLAGRAYDLAGQPILAAKCYAGQWPLP